MKRFLTTLSILFLTGITLTGFTQNVGVGINPDGAQPHASAILDVSSTQHGMLIPRMTSTQKGNISEPAEGLMIYQTDDSKGYYYYTGTAWKRIIDESSQSIQVQGQAGETLRHDGTDWVASGNLYNNDGNIGIGTTNPQSLLEISNKDNSNTFLNLRAASDNEQKIGISLIRHSAHLTPSRWEIFRDQEDSHKLKFRFYSEGLTVEPFNILTLFAQSTTSGGVGIGTTNPAPSALLEMSSASQGLLIPRMTQEQRNNIHQPSTSLLIFQTDQTPGFYYNAGTPASPNWMPLSSSNGLSSGNQAGEMLYWNGNEWVSVNPGLEGQVLTFLNGQPTWTCIVTLAAPTEGSHITGANHINWRWNNVSGAAGYKYNTVNDYNTANDNGTSMFFNQTGLNCCLTYNLYVWAYNACGNSPVRLMTSGTFQQVTIKTSSAPGESCVGSDPRYAFYISNPETGVFYQWQLNDGLWVDGTGIMGTDYPGTACCGSVNPNTLRVRGVRNDVTSSSLGSHYCGIGGSK